MNHSSTFFMGPSWRDIYRQSLEVLVVKVGNFQSLLLRNIQPLLTVVVLTDSGYDNKHIEKAISDKKWLFIIALKKTRSVKSEHLYATTPKSKQWSQVSQFFRNQRRLKWTTIRLMTNGKKSKRMEFRIRHTKGYLR